MLCCQLPPLPLGRGQGRGSRLITPSLSLPLKVEGIGQLDIKIFGNQML